MLVLLTTPACAARSLCDAGSSAQSMPTRILGTMHGVLLRVASYIPGIITLGPGWGRENEK